MGSRIRRVKLTIDSDMVCSEAKTGHVHLYREVRTFCSINLDELVDFEDDGIEYIDHNSPEKVTCPDCIKEAKWWYDWVRQIKSRRLLSRKKYKE